MRGPATNRWPTAKTNAWSALLLNFAVDCAGLTRWEYMAGAKKTPAMNEKSKENQRKVKGQSKENSQENQRNSKGKSKENQLKNQRTIKRKRTKQH